MRCNPTLSHGSERVMRSRPRPLFQPRLLLLCSMFSTLKLSYSSPIHTCVSSYSCLLFKCSLPVRYKTAFFSAQCSQPPNSSYLPCSPTLHLSTLVYLLFFSSFQMFSSLLNVLNPQSLLTHHALLLFTCLSTRVSLLLSSFQMFSTSTSAW